MLVVSVRRVYVVRPADAFERRLKEAPAPAAGGVGRNAKLHGAVLIELAFGCQRDDLACVISRAGVLCPHNHVGSCPLVVGRDPGEFQWNPEQWFL